MTTRPTQPQLVAARAAVRAALPPTPLVACPELRPGAWIKLESLLPTGSFKPRGAVAALAAVAPGTPVVIASAGNAALGMGWAAGRLGSDVRAVVPENASPAKLRKLERAPLTVIRHGASFDDADAHARQLAHEDGLHYLSTDSDPNLIAGYATIGPELDHVLDGPLTVICPVGGGGLISGLCLWARDRRDVTVVGAEAAASPAMGASLRAGRIVEVDVRPTIADGLAGNIEDGSVTFEIAQQRIDALVDVEEDEIRAAIRFLALERGVVAEGAGAVATAALLQERVRVAGQAVVLLSGSNIDLALLASILSEGG